MSLPKGRKRKGKEDETIKLETISSETNGTSKKLKQSGEVTETGSHECFCCKQEGDNLMKCSLDSCLKFYHKKCLEGLPSVKTDANLCPLHICLTCHNANPKNSLNSKGDMTQCEKCPLAFHDKDACKIPGTVVSDKETLCPKHFTPEKFRGIKELVKLPFCVECSCNEDLIFCSSCPAAVHIQCLKLKVPFIGEYKCDRCRSGKTILFNDVVWSRVYDYRWWPALVLDPNNEDISEMPHYDGEFPVKWFGREEYYWVNPGRAYPFFHHKINIEAENLKHNVKKVIPNKCFDEAVQLALAAMAEQKLQSVEKSSSNKKPPPFKYVKCNKPVGNVQVNVLDVSGDVTCGCKPEDENPCGYDSMCLNRSMCTECYEDLCEAGAKCQNQKFQKAEYVNAKPYWTETRGWGLKLMEDIKKGTFIAEYCGDLIDEEEMNRRIQQKQLVGDTNFYFCTLDANRIIDAGPKGCISRFMNHSCDPNCETQKWMVLGDARVGIFAKKDLKSGAELTFDYQMDFSHFDKLKCNCGAKRCAGLIGKKLKNGLLDTDDEEENQEDSSSDSEEMNSEKSSRSKVQKASSKKKNRVSKNDNSKIKKEKNVKDDEDDQTSSKKLKKSAKLQNGDAKKETKNGGSKTETPSKDKIVKSDSNNKAFSRKSTKLNQNGDSKKHDELSDDEGNEKPSKKSLKLNQNEKSKLSDDDDFKDNPKPKKAKKDKPVCFKCKTGGKVTDCSVKNCHKSFHVRCLAPKQKPGEKDKFKCPSHFCKKCKAGSTYQCYLCPNAYCEEHVTEKPDSDKFACPKHCDSD
ncbi:hypothetical protein JTE90_012588 [Oedothorax gibbosus]|uniref:Histone-lysine N-methyltransferase NSD2 n=1 Tax=Oedothorax gibbosus TaxID=931172 RepID=A0AAV6V0R5_9ARAC|nr:hypothetical protein JTE90_012588 [Oedothorax gibbosus]